MNLAQPIKKSLIFLLLDIKCSFYFLQLQVYIIAIGKIFGIYSAKYNKAKYLFQQ